MLQPTEVNTYWLEELGPKGWYAGGAALDQEIRDRFQTPWQEARTGAYQRWMTCASGALAYLILLDQMPRNMFRDTADAFATDAMARACATLAIKQGFDKRVSGDARQFFYMPFMHSESAADQERGVRLFLMNLPGGNVLHARAHREVIRMFGRFPYRNDALGRKSTAPELAFLAKGGYSEAMRLVQA